MIFWNFNNTMYNVSRYIDSISLIDQIHVCKCGRWSTDLQYTQKAKEQIRYARLVSVLLVIFSMSAKAQIRYASKQTEHCLASRISLASTLQQSLHKQISARTCVLPWYSKFWRKQITIFNFFLLFKLYTRINSYGNVGTASSLNHTFSQHKLTSTSRLDQAFYKA